MSSLSSCEDILNNVDEITSVLPPIPTNTLPFVSVTQVSDSPDLRPALLPAPSPSPEPRTQPAAKPSTKPSAPLPVPPQVTSVTINFLDEGVVTPNGKVWVWDVRVKASLAPAATGPPRTSVKARSRKQDPKKN